MREDALYKQSVSLGLARKVFNSRYLAEETAKSASKMHSDPRKMISLKTVAKKPAYAMQRVQNA